MRRSIYRAKDQWILCTCNECNALNYVEPHGIDAQCASCKRRTDHSNIPQEFRDASGCYLVRPVERAFDLYWAPEGKCIATVTASTRRAAIRKTPAPYRRYLGEVYAKAAS